MGFKKPSKVAGPTTEEVYVSFTTANGADPTVTYAQGVTSVVRAAEGVFDITVGTGFHSAVPTYSIEGANISHVPHTVSITPATRIIKMALRAITDGTTADDDPGAIVHARILLRTSK